MAGRSRAIKIPRTAITTSNSTRVKPSRAPARTATQSNSIKHRSTPLNPSTARHCCLSLSESRTFRFAKDDTYSRNGPKWNIASTRSAKRHRRQTEQNYAQPDDENQAEARGRRLGDEQGDLGEERVRDGDGFQKRRHKRREIVRFRQQGRQTCQQRRATQPLAFQGLDQDYRVLPRIRRYGRRGLVRMAIAQQALGSAGLAAAANSASFSAAARTKAGGSTPCSFAQASFCVIV